MNSSGLRQIDVHLKKGPVLDRFLEHYYMNRPVNATFTGVHDYDSLLPDWSPDGLQRTCAEMATLRTQLAPNYADSAASHRFNGLGEPLEIDCALADAFLEIQIAEYEGSHFQRGNPSLHTGEAVFAVVSLMLRDFAPANERARAIERRLWAMSGFFETAEQAIGGRPVPPSWIARALDECQGAMRLFGDGLEAWCACNSLTAKETAVLEKASTNAQGGVADFRSWLLSRAEAPDRHSGCGPEFYDLVLQRGHWCFRSREDLLKEARERFDEAEQTLDEMARTVDSGGWSAVSARLDAQHPSATGYLETFDLIWKACRNLAEQEAVVTWPDSPICYVEVPGWARAAAPHLYFLNYRSPAPFDDHKVHEYLVPFLDRSAQPEIQEKFLRNVNDSVIKLNHVVHHGAIGHHVQNFYAKQSQSKIGQIAAVDCASRIGMFCGGSMAEGWACYATDLMGEIGFQTELELVAEQHSRLRQLARAITDIELHQHTWSESDARVFFEERIGMGAGAAAKEVTRTSMFPGTAIMYWLGTQGIHDLRAELQGVAGPNFSLRSFHDRFLSFGSIPVPLIARLMTESIT